MALENTDLLVAYRVTEQKHYKVKVSDLPGGTGSGVPDGNDRDDILIWNGSSWAPGTIDGGEYAV